MDIFIMYVYKIYAEIMRNRLKEEIEEKNLIPENQVLKKGEQQ